MNTDASGTDDEPWLGLIEYPVFYLHEAVNGVIDEQTATRAAIQLLDPLGVHANRLHIRVKRQPHNGYWISPVRALHPMPDLDTKERPNLDAGYWAWTP